MTRRHLLSLFVFVVAVACNSSSPVAPGSIGGSGNPSPGPNLNSDFETQVVSIMNERRAAGTTCGPTTLPPVPALTMNANLREAAREHSIDMVNRHYYSHTTPEGKTFEQRIQESGYLGPALGETLAAGQTTPQDAVNSWLTSNGHCGLIMDARGMAIGVGFADNHWTAKFGG